MVVAELASNWSSPMNPNYESGLFGLHKQNGSNGGLPINAIYEGDPAGVVYTLPLGFGTHCNW
jgi:hypothetical protein